MLQEPITILTDTLVDLLDAIIDDEGAVTATDAARCEQIQRELQRRRDKRHWGFVAIN